MLVVTARHGADVRFLGGEVGGYSLLEVVPCKVVLQVPVRVLGGRLELTNGTDLDSVLSGVSGNP